MLFDQLLTEWLLQKPSHSNSRDPAQLDSPFVREYEIKEGIASQCGRTILEGKMDIGYQMEKCQSQFFVLVFFLHRGSLNFRSQSTAEDGGLPNINKDGTIKVIAHQVNGDGKLSLQLALPRFTYMLTLPPRTGAGPYTCAVDLEAKGEKFQNVPVTINVPGENSKSNTKATDFTLQTKMPQNGKCTGGADGQTCILRCLNVSWQHIITSFI